MSAASVPFGQTPDGHPAQLLTLENSELRVRITDFGGRIVSIEMLRPKTADFDVLLGLTRCRNTRRPAVLLALCSGATPTASRAAS